MSTRMKTELCVLAVYCLSSAIAEVVFVKETNNGHHKRQFDLDLPENLQFDIKHRDEVVSLSLRENTRLNANAPIYVPMTDETGNTKIVKSKNIKRNHEVRCYQDHSNGAAMKAECMKTQNGPCRRILTGSLVIKGSMYTLEPVHDEKDKRLLHNDDWAPYKLEPVIMDRTREIISDNFNGRQTVSSLKRSNSKTPKISDEEIKVARDIQEEEKVHRSSEESEKNINSRKKRSPGFHTVEVLFAVDHSVYDKFAEDYIGDDTIKLEIAKYIAYVVNGVDLIYDSIQEADLAIGITIVGIFISNDTNQSPWMNYSTSPTDLLMGLENMVQWRTQDKLPKHDHACLVTRGFTRKERLPGQTLGLAFTNTACLPHCVSVVRNGGYIELSRTMAHELGHNLGAEHDTQDSQSSCAAQSGYIMAPEGINVGRDTQYIEPWRFSSCSVSQFRAYFTSLGVNDCTLNAGDYEQPEELFGHIYSLDEQCASINGGWFEGDNNNTRTICRNMICAFGTKLNDRAIHLAADGTPCGNAMVCYHGICQDIRVSGFDNLALNKPATQSTNASNAKLAVDGNKDPFFSHGSCSQAESSTLTIWWKVDLEHEALIFQVRILNRINYASRLKELTIKVDTAVCGYLEGPGDSGREYYISCETPLVGREVLITKKSTSDTTPLNLCEVEVIGQYLGLYSFTNLALNKPTNQSSTNEDAYGSLAVDGIKDPVYNSGSCSHTSNNAAYHWWLVDLQKTALINEVRFLNTENKGWRLSTVHIWVGTTLSNLTLCESFLGPGEDGKQYNISCRNPEIGRYVILYKPNNDTEALVLCEVEVIGRFTDVPNIALNKTATQSSTAHGGSADKAVDGNDDSLYSHGSCTHTDKHGVRSHWWLLDLGSNADIFLVTIQNRYTFGERLADTAILYGTSTTNMISYNYIETGVNNKLYIFPVGRDRAVVARYIKIMKRACTTVELTLCEVAVVGWYI